MLLFGINWGQILAFPANLSDFPHKWIKEVRFELTQKRVTFQEQGVTQYKERTSHAMLCFDAWRDQQKFEARRLLQNHAESAFLRGPLPSLDLRQLQLSSILPQRTAAGHLSVWIKPTGQLKSY